MDGTQDGLENLTVFQHANRIIRSFLGAARRLARSFNIAPSFNGRTAASGAAYRGSNPWGATK